MSPMRFSPRRCRRALQVVDALLAAALIAALIGAWTSAGAADPLDPSLREGCERARRAGLRWRAPTPVAREALQAVLWRHTDLQPPHWPLSGPLPPPTEVAAAHLATPQALPDDLGALGRVRMVAHDPGLSTAIGFEFADSPSVHAFAPGDIVRAAASDPARFRLLAVEVPDRSTVRVRYAVLEDGRVVATRVLLQREDDAPARAQPHTWRLEAAPPARASERAAAPRPPQEPIAWERMRAVVVVDPKHPNDREIRIDATTHAALRSGGAATLAEMVKTTPLVDARGAALGLRIVGFAKGLAPDVFDVRPGDVLVSLAGHPVRTRADALRIARSLDPDAGLIEVIVDRGGREIRYRVDGRDARTRRTGARLLPRD